MGYGAWVGGKRPSHHPGGLGWGAWVGAWPLGLGLKPGMERASKMTWRALNGQRKLAISHAPMCQLMPPTQAPPYPTGVGLGLFSMCQLVPPTQAPPYPIFLTKVYVFYSKSILFCSLIFYVKVRYY
ncbi:hypothetical protein Hanom_Chr13g01186761 [Helianthus anomalus]